MKQRFFMGSTEALGDREIGVVASTAQLARDGHVLEPSGINLTNYRSNPIVLFSHDPKSPVGVATAVGVENNSLAARIQFAPPGVSAIADQCCSLTKGGVLRGISIGFDILDAEPLDPKKPYAGQHILKSELYEISVVSIPADTGAGVVARGVSHRSGFAFSALRRIPPAAVQRAAARIAPRRDGMIVNPTMHVWSLLEARERDRREHRAWAQQELRRLRAVAARY